MNRSTASASVRPWFSIARGMEGLLVGLFLMLTLPGRSAYVEGGADAFPPPPVRDPAGFSPERRVTHQWASFRRLVSRLEVAPPCRYRHLTVFPLILKAADARTGIRTLDEALDRGWIVLREQADARVSTIEVRNISSYPILLMAGELIAGGRQNRIVQSDTLLAPFSKVLELPVYCGEKGRWSGPGDDFSDGRELADYQLRELAVRAEPQENIWREIDNQLAHAGEITATRSYRQIFKNRDIERGVSAGSSEFKQVLCRDTVGAVLVAGDRILCCDLFSDPDLFSRAWADISRSYLLDCWVGIRGADDRGGPRYGGLFGRMAVPRLKRADISRFLQQAADGEARDVPTPGVGRGFQLQGSVSGSVLVWQDEVVHAALFGSPRPVLKGGVE